MTAARVGIQGGTFNPIHWGHLRGAEEVREALGLDEVRFIPSASPPHKDGEDVAPAADRLEMVRMAVEDHPGFVCDPIEVERGGLSYTWDTVNALASGACRGKELHFIIGADAFRELHIWHRPFDLLRAVHFAVTLRGAQRREEVLAGTQEALRAIEPDFRFEQIGENEFKAVDSEMVVNFIRVSTLDISATRIRALLGSGGSVRYLLPRPVELFIIRRRLYGATDEPPATKR